jgi:putative endonuclease
MLVSSDKTKTKGFFGEVQVVTWLQKNGYKIVAQNYTTKFGEIDIIAQKGDVVSFIEVKMRMTTYFDLSELINYSKQRKIISTAKRYIALYGNHEQIYQFDVALVEKLPEGQFGISYLPNAFYGSEFS